MTVQEKIDMARGVLKQKIREIKLDLTLPINLGKVREAKSAYLKQLEDCLRLLDKISESKLIIRLLEIFIR